MSADEAGAFEQSSVGAGADFAAVVAAHWTTVYRLLLRMTGSSHDAEELAQETFLRALAHRDRFQPGTKMKAWLLRIATNAWFDVRRKRGRIKLEAIEQLAVDPPAKPPDESRQLENAEQAELARAALDVLSDLTRLVFHLRVQEELSFRAIAAIAGTTEQSARWHMCQARKKLLERLSGD